MKPTSSKGRSPWKVKKTRRTVAGGIVIRKGDILVNQGLGKVKLEDDYVDLKPELPISMQLDAISGTSFTGTISGGGEAFTEEYQVTKVEVDIPNIPLLSDDTPAPNEDGGHYDHAATKEIEALKRTMKQFSLQMDQQNEAIKKQDETIRMQNEAIKKQDEAIKFQNEVIGGMKSFIRNIGLSMATYFNNDEKEENGGGCRHGNNEKSPAKHSGSTVENSLVFEFERPSGSDSRCGHSGEIQDNSQEDGHCNYLIVNVSGASAGTSGTSDIQQITDVPSKQASVFMEFTSIVDPGQCSEHGNMNFVGEGVGGSDDSSNGHAIESSSEQNHNDSSGSPGTSSNKAGFTAEHNAEDRKDSDLDDHDDADLHENNDEGTYVPDDSEGESGSEMEEERNEIQIRLASTKISTKINEESSTSTTDSTANSEGSFGCSKCDKCFKSEKSLSHHIRHIHSKNRHQFKCHLCPKVFNCKSSVCNHISSIHKGIRYKCTYCPGTFYQTKDVAKHEKSVHKTGATPSQQCKICGIQLNSKKSLLCHVAKMHYESRTSQGVKSLPKKRKPEAIRIKRGTVRTKHFQCQHCYSSFPELNDLQCHLSQSHGIPPGSEAEK